MKFKNKINQKGITLIALIITIIVMLILVGVCVTVALNGGLFTTAKKAVDETQIAIEREQLLSAVLGAIRDDVKIDFDKLGANLPEGFEEVEEERTETKRTYESETGNKYQIDENGTIVEPENIGVPVTLPEGLVVGSEFEMDADQDGTNETWIVLHAGTEVNSHLNQNEIEVISKNVMGKELSLGYDDKTAQNPGDVDLDGILNSDIDKGIYSFENSINTLNSYCEGLIKIKNNGVRCVGSNPSNKSYVNTAHTDDSVVTHLPDWKDEAVATWNKYKLLAGTTDENFNTDYNKMKTLGIVHASYYDNEGWTVPDCPYWLASRYVYDVGNWSGFVEPYLEGSAQFCVRYVDGSSLLTSHATVWRVETNGSVNVFELPYRCRPVVKLQYIQSND